MELALRLNYMTDKNRVIFKLNSVRGYPNNYPTSAYISFYSASCKRIDCIHIIDDNCTNLGSAWRESITEDNRNHRDQEQKTQKPKPNTRILTTTVALLF